MTENLVTELSVNSHTVLAIHLFDMLNKILNTVVIVFIQTDDRLLRNFIILQFCTSNF